MEKSIGIVGCGNIGGGLAKYIDHNMKNNVSKVLIWDVDEKKLKALNKQVSNCEIAKDLNHLVENSDLLVEAVSPEVVESLLNLVILKGKDILIMSVGGILGNEILLEDARNKGIKVILPSGAIAGIDALKAASIAGIDEISITTRKPPKSIKGADYLKEKKIDVDKIEKETVVFNGNAKEAIKAFPKNINVSAILSLAGIGAARTNVKIIVSPSFERNSHEINVKGKFGEIRAITENIPSPENPKTSYLAVLSAISAVKGYCDSVQIGT